MKRHALFAASSLTTIIIAMIIIGIGVLIVRRFVIAPEPTSSGTVGTLRPTSNAPFGQSEPIAIYSAVLHHLFRNPQGTPGRERWDVIYLNPTLYSATDLRSGTPTPAPALPVPDGLLAVLADLAPHIELKARRDFGAQMPWGTISVSLGPIKQSGDSATVGVDWLLSGIVGEGYEYRVMRADGVWKVIEARMIWIS